MRPATRLTLILLYGLFAFLLGVNAAHAQLPMGVPDFGASPTKVSVRDGAWEDPETWGGSVPTVTDTVKVAHALTLQTGTAKVIGVTGSLGLQRGATLSVGTLLVYEQGVLAIGSQAAPGAATVTFQDQALDFVRDPEQFGTGLIVFGRIQVHGAPVPTPFARVNAEVLAGASTVTFAASPGWQVGDRIVFPDTRQLTFQEQQPATYQLQAEERTVTAVLGTTIVFSPALSFAHRGAGGYLPHVANLTRTVRFRSANPAGTRGHGIFIHRADVDIRYASFEDLGRTTAQPLDSTAGSHIGTNQIGRYDLHLHHLAGPANTGGRPQFTLEGNVTIRSRKWPIAIHNAHFGLIRGNVVYDFLGAGIVAEDGSETQNVFERNFALVGKGEGGRQGDGREGIGFWFKGPDNFVRDNVASTIRSYDGGVDSAYGYKFYPYFLGDVNQPVAPGSLTTVKRNGNALPIREFVRNEVYGAVESGLTFWWLGSWGDSPQATQTSVFKDTVMWNFHNKAVFVYPSSKVHIDGLTVRAAGPGMCGVGIDFSDYLAHDFQFSRLDIRGCVGAMGGTPNSLGTTIVVRDSTFANHANISIGTQATVSAWAGSLTDRRWRFENVALTVNRLDVPYTSGNVILGYQGHPTSGPVLLDEIIINNERVFKVQQAPNFIVPVTTQGPDNRGPNVIGAPVAGLTNAQAWAQYGIAIGGAVATCSTTRPDYVGAFVCPIVGVPQLPDPATNLGIR
jgi:hypothetical protein